MNVPYWMSRRPHHHYPNLCMRSVTMDKYYFEHSSLCTSYPSLRPFSTVRLLNRPFLTEVTVSLLFLVHLAGRPLTGSRYLRKRKILLALLHSQYSISCRHTPNCFLQAVTKNETEATRQEVHRIQKRF